MVSPKHGKQNAFIYTFMALSFVAGFVLVTAAQRNTEDRSKAAGVSPGPYLVSPFVTQPPLSIDQQIKVWIAAGKKVFDQGAIKKGNDVECKTGTKVIAGPFTWCQ